MENKYYTPSIEEFHVGFEYETNYLQDYDNWVEDVITQEDAGYFFDSYITDSSPLEFRVKYLDKEDIESLGFVETSNNWFTIDAPGKLGYWTQVVIDFRWMHRTEPYKDISISGKRGHENDIIFRGIIKNKSELKRLLKQLNVI